jgi:hypothetical protein
MMTICQQKQSITESWQGCAISTLLHEPPPRLSAWYATPLTRRQLANLQSATQQELQTRLCNGASCYALHVLQFVFRFQQQVDVEPGYQQLLAAAQNVPEQALLELVYGQLLASCKQTGALQHLANGFALAAGFLSSTDYFRLLRQHESLGWLRFATTASAPQSLQFLLTEAAVIKQLQGETGVPFEAAHLDTLG